MSPSPGFLIETQRAHVPWRWVILLTLLSQSRILVIYAAASMTFTMRKFISDPAIINSISSLDVFFNLLVAAPCLYYSDRIWTPLGRRLPFILVSFLVLGSVLLLLPFAGSAVPLAALIVLYLIFWDVGDTYDTLMMEIIPPDQRPRAAAIAMWFQNATIMLSAVVISGRFDDVTHAAGLRLSGEQLIYWSAAGCLVFCTIFLLLFVRERRPAAAPPQDTRKPQGALSRIFTDRTLWPAYLLVFTAMLVQTNLGAIEPLLMTEQWGYSKQDIGTNIFVGGVVNLALVIPLIGLLTDKMNRLRVFGIGVAGVLLSQLAYYVFVQFILPDQRPGIPQIIFFGYLLSIANQFISVSLMPLLYDYIPRDKMGTAQAGLSFVRSVTRLLTLNSIGLWVSIYSQLFLPAGRYDYLSGYILIIALNAAGAVGLLYFALQVRRGKFQPLGRTQFQPVDEPSR